MKNIYEEQYLNLQEEIFLIKNFLPKAESITPSKSRLQKCNKGLHEYKDNKCIHCKKTLTIY